VADRHSRYAALEIRDGGGGWINEIFMVERGRESVHSYILRYNIIQQPLYYLPLTAHMS